MLKNSVTFGALGWRFINNRSEIFCMSSATLFENHCQKTVCLCNHKIKLKLGDSEKNRITSKASFVFVLFFAFLLATLPLALLHYKCNKSKKKKKSANNRSQEETRILLAKGATQFS